MTKQTTTFKQKRIDNVSWSGISRLPSSPDDAKSLTSKVPLFYLTTVSVNAYEDDVYFVNNTDQTLSFVAPFMLYKDMIDARVTLGDISENNVNKAKLYAEDMELLYTKVLPYQGVRIGSTHIIYDSDGLLQWFIHVPFKGRDTHYGIWRFNVVETGGMSQTSCLLWEDFNKPVHLVDAEFLSDPSDIPIEPSIYDERCWVLDQLIDSLGTKEALFVLGINDVLYRYCVGWSAPYNESDIQAKDIAHKLQTLNPKDIEAVKQIIQTVYDFWFDKGFAKNISTPACAEIFDWYQAKITNR